MFYYLFKNLTPDKINADRDGFLRAHHLAHLAGECSDAVVAPVAGKTPGTLLIPRPLGVQNVAVSGYKPDLQTWLDLGELSIGWLTDDPPRPDQLLRREHNALGLNLPDAGGRLWAIPIARAENPDRITTPISYRFDLATGKPTKNYQASPLWDLAGRAWDHWHGDNTLTDDALAALALSIVSAQYRVGMPEVNALDEMGLPLLDSVRVWMITRAVIDKVLIDEAEKKALGDKYQPARAWIEFAAWRRDPRHVPGYRPSYAALGLIAAAEDI